MAAAVTRLLSAAFLLLEILSLSRSDDSAPNTSAPPSCSEWQISFPGGDKLIRGLIDRSGGSRHSIIYL